MKSRSLLLCGLLLLGGGCAARSQSAPVDTTTVNGATANSATINSASANIPAPEARRLSWSVLQSFPHDTGAFTEGLLWSNGALYESTGLEGHSSVRRVDLATGQVLQKRDLSPRLFGEGLALAGGKLYNLTWQTKVGFVIDPTTLEPKSRFSYNNEGWGLTFDGKELIQSDGSDTLTFRDPANFASTRTLRVTWNGRPQKDLNELEWIDGVIWANVWQTDTIVLIDPKTGAVQSYLDFTGLLRPTDRTGNEDVMNGIAYDVKDKRIFLTGKNWPKLYWVQVQH